MAKNYRIELESNDLGQLLDGLEMRAVTWEKTADYLRNGGSSDAEPFIIEECSKPEEADDIAEHYRSIIGKFREQMEAQR